MSIDGIGGGGAMGVDRVMALRAQILERNQALARAGATSGAAPAAASKPASFAATMEDALKSVNQGQVEAGKLSEAYERGETIDIAKVMMARQQASVGFEATLQVRNKLLSAYKDIMSMPV
ncbi:flagellar hook-basal body complex protein FliE [Sphingomonas sp. BE270]|jgi:flagellar hook-basal body complex protein FliE|uniref:flagellar hook-basal body complex protein FliE n=2 Tax=Pseudomonadota TaxID=1224 RepID=UPI000AE4A849|nr:MULTISPECIES: flagellar hook-basal body complex protein FliE [unclassified Sphingomonas]MDR6848084.1 flagellar hook-basal body complex protein FliE [Sphingomonas sp. BE137]MDR7258236.1 flagellar hook-basal body complex protein FliE [Sphingomonas sp. BE270]